MAAHGHAVIVAARAGLGGPFLVPPACGDPLRTAVTQGRKASEDFSGSKSRLQGWCWVDGNTVAFREAGHVKVSGLFPVCVRAQDSSAPLGPEYSQLNPLPCIPWRESEKLASDLTHSLNQALLVNGQPVQPYRWPIVQCTDFLKRYPSFHLLFIEGSSTPGPVLQIHK